MKHYNLSGNSLQGTGVGAHVDLEFSTADYIQDPRARKYILGLQAALGKNGHGKYADAVFCFADERNPNQHATYSALFIGQN